MQPLVQRGLYGQGFRVIWRVHGEQQETAWAQVAARRLEADAFLSAQPSIGLFVSSVTGAFTKPSHKGQAPQEIFPALAYWVVGHDHTMNINTLITQVSNLFGRVETREIGSGRTPQDRMSSSLFVVLKDHSNSYVRKRNVESLVSLGSQATMPTSRMIVLHESFHDFVCQAMGEVAKMGLDLKVEYGGLQAAIEQAAAEIC